MRAQTISAFRVCQVATTSTPLSAGSASMANGGLPLSVTARRPTAGPYIMCHRVCSHTTATRRLASPYAASKTPDDYLRLPHVVSPRKSQGLSLCLVITNFPWLRINLAALLNFVRQQPFADVDISLLVRPWWSVFVP